MICHHLVKGCRLPWPLRPLRSRAATGLFLTNQSLSSLIVSWSSIRGLWMQHFSVIDKRREGGSRGFIFITHTLDGFIVLSLKWSGVRRPPSDTVLFQIAWSIKRWTTASPLPVSLPLREVTNSNNPSVRTSTRSGNACVPSPLVRPSWWLLWCADVRDRSLANHIAFIYSRGISINSGKHQVFTSVMLEMDRCLFYRVPEKYPATASLDTCKHTHDR